MKKLPFLILFFTIILMMKHDVAFSQRDRVPPTPTRDGWGPVPNPGSIWVNRDDTINGRPVHELTPAELIEDVLLGQGGGSCSTGGTISNVTFTGYGWNGSSWGSSNPGHRSLSYFSHGTIGETINVNGYPVSLGLGMEKGLLLSTSSGRDAEGPNSAPGGMGTPTNIFLTGDPDLAWLSPGYIISNGAKLEFNFIPLQSVISFDYIFASEEYPNFANSGFNDVFGFFVWELDRFGSPIPSSRQSIAKLPTTTTSTDVVSINNVNGGQHSVNNPSNFPQCTGYNGPCPNVEYYIPNFGQAPFGVYSEFNGRTVVLTAKANVVPGRSYRLKLIVANVG